MFDDLDPRSPTPLYEQIAARIRVAVASGEVTPGEALPSVRALAGELRVNPATVVQAYRELQAGGFVEKRHGAGTFVRAVPETVKDGERRLRARELARDALVSARRMGIPPGALLEAFQDEVAAAGSPASTEEKLA